MLVYITAFFSIWQEEISNFLKNFFAMKNRQAAGHLPRRLPDTVFCCSEMQKSAAATIIAARAAAVHIAAGTLIAAADPDQDDNDDDPPPAYITTIRVLLFRFTPQISLLYALFYFVFYIFSPAFPAAGTYLVRSQPFPRQQKPPPDAGTLPVHGGDFACLLLCAAGLTLPLKLTVGLPPTCSAGGRPVLYEYGGALTLSFIDLSG